MRSLPGVAYQRRLQQRPLQHVGTILSMCTCQARLWFKLDGKMLRKQHFSLKHLEPAALAVGHFLAVRHSGSFGIRICCTLVAQRQISLAALDGKLFWKSQPPSQDVGASIAKDFTYIFNSIGTWAYIAYSTWNIGGVWLIMMLGSGIYRVPKQNFKFV